MPSENGEKTDYSDFKDDKGRFVEGNPGGPGRPLGSVSIKERIKQHLRENPSQLQELVEYYLKEEAPVMRKLLWEMIDGKPSQQVDMTHDIPEHLIELIKHANKGGNKELSEENSE